MKKQNFFGNVVNSLAVMVALILANLLLCNAVQWVVRQMIIPTISMFSYDFHLYIEKLYYSKDLVEEQAMLFMTVYAIAAIPMLFLGARFAYRAAITRGRYFKEKTNALINYPDGMKMYFREHALFDAAVAAVVVLILMLNGSMIMVFPTAWLFYSLFGPVLGYFITLAVVLLTIPLGAFHAQKKWRAQYICARLS